MAGTGGSISTTRELVENCRCDDVGAGVIVRYVEAWGVDVAGTGAAPVLVGRWREGDPGTPYVPVNPVDCP